MSLTDLQSRAIYLEVPGHAHVRTSTSTGSLANIKYLNLVMSLVEGPLRVIYGATMNDNVAIITPYARQHDLYDAKMRDLQAKGWAESSLPRVWTAETARGREATHVVLDFVNCMSSEDDLGFRHDDPRALTFLTRAMEAQWIVGGKPDKKFMEDVREDGLSKYPFVYWYMRHADGDCVVRRDGGEVREDEWPADLKKKGE